MQGLFPRCFVLRFLSLLSSLGAAAATEVFAGYVVVLGDATATFPLIYDSYAGHEGNRTFFMNLLGGGESVLIPLPSRGNYDVIERFYDERIPGFAASTEVTLSDQVLNDFNLVVFSRVIRTYSVAEIDAVSRYLARGGNILFVVEPPGARDAEAVRESTHALLADLRVPMRLVNPLFDVGSHTAAGENIGSHPLTQGVATFSYGWASHVQGGTPLFFGSTGYPFAAAVFIPEPAALVLTAAGVLGLAWRKRSSGREVEA